MSGGVEKLRDIPEVLEFTIIIKLNTFYKWRDNKVITDIIGSKEVTNFLVLLKPLLLHSLPV